jgi:hypothetical protein
LQENGTKLMWLLNPGRRIDPDPVLHPGRDWSLIAIGP